MHRSAPVSSAVLRIRRPLERACFIGKSDSDPTHPRLGPDAAHPVREGRDAPKVFEDVLLGDQAHGHLAPRGVRDRRAEQGFRSETPLGVVAEGAVPEVGDDEFRSVHYMDRLVRRALSA
jgi:hypothetical protein